MISFEKLKMKPVDILATNRDVRGFRKSLEERTQIFKKFDKRKRKAYLKFRFIVLD